MAFLNFNAQCTEISSCGNWVVLGYSSGHVDKYNLESGAFRGSFIDAQAAWSRGPTRMQQQSELESDPLLMLGTAHSLVAASSSSPAAAGTETEATSTSTSGPVCPVAVRGLCVDACNQQLVTGGSLDCRLKFWHWRTHRRLAKLDLPAPVSALHLHRDRYYTQPQLLESA